jgi:hypothetical protein
MLKKVIAFILILIISTGCFMSCGEKNNEKSHMLSFLQAQSVEAIKNMDGETVSMIGYMSTLSPVSGKFMYLMNLPYQSCPFCIPNTTTLSNTIAVYAKNEFEFTDRAIQVTGILEVGDWTDEFGYNYGYRIKNATYEILDTNNMSKELKQWQALASTNVVADIYAMYDYINFLCFWCEYTATFGETQDYLYPEDVPVFLAADSQFGYASNENYFDNLIARVKEVDETAFNDLIKNIQAAKALAERAKSEINNGNYSQVSEYTNIFKDGRAQYKMNNYDDLVKEFQETYGGFADWLSNWEL